MTTNIFFKFLLVTKENVLNINILHFATFNDKTSCGLKKGTQVFGVS